jgi:hypothetical protein
MSTTKDERLKEFAAQTLEAQKLEPSKRSDVIKDIMKDAKSFNMGPNEVLSRAMSLQKENEVKENAGKIVTLSEFNKQWMKINTNIGLNSPKYQEDFNAYVKTVKNFNYHA